MPVLRSARITASAGLLVTLALTTAACTGGGDTSSPGPATPTTGRSSAAPTSTRASADNSALVGRTHTWTRVGSKANAGVQRVVAGLPGVLNAAYYPDEHRLTVYFRPSATQRQRAVATGTVTRQLRASSARTGR